jgi:hypothetical protein
MPDVDIPDLKKIRISIWLDRKDHEDFNRLYPMHGAFTNFVRKALSLRLKKVTADVEGIINE